MNSLSLADKVLQEFRSCPLHFRFSILFPSFDFYRQQVKLFINCIPCTFWNPYPHFFQFKCARRCGLGRLYIIV